MDRIIRKEKALPAGYRVNFPVAKEGKRYNIAESSKVYLSLIIPFKAG